MDEIDFRNLATARLKRASELISEAKLLLDNNSYKSANNRAYYAIEKSISALLAIKQIQTKTHKGCLKQFNMSFINDNKSEFTLEDYQLVARAQQIRNASDYDDFYIVSKQVTITQVKDAEYMYNKIQEYIESQIK